MKGFRPSMALLLAGGATVSLSMYSRAAGPIIGTPPVPVPAMIPKKIVIDLDKSVPIKVPSPKFDLKVTVFETPDHKQGWAIRLPGNRPIATPAYWNNMLFVGGGYGSHEFYAFDATTGGMVWKYNTGDDGPTAAVVEDGYCAFNTESCTVYVLNAKTGKLIWQQWLGDPLMSQPAIWNGRLYIAYPGGQRQQNNQSSGRPGHRMLCADLKTGKHLWDAPITADVISAPILHDGKAYFTCQDGTSFCLNATTGAQVFKKADGSTSAPTIAADDRIMVAQKKVVGDETRERVAFYAGSSNVVHAWDKRADYVAAPRAGKASQASPVPGLSKDVEHEQDASVGFATAPAAASLDSVQSNVPLGSVVAGWAYQGSRPAFNSNRMLAVNAQGSTINALADAKAKSAINWSAQARGGGIDESSQVFSPPALGKENLYLVSGKGHLLAVDQSSGKVQFSYATHQPMMFQPALANGNMYVGTSTGMLICLKTGMSDADGWDEWGGNAQHNKENFK